MTRGSVLGVFLAATVHSAPCVSWAWGKTAAAASSEKCEMGQARHLVWHF